MFVNSSLKQNEVLIKFYQKKMGRSLAVIVMFSFQSDYAVPLTLTKMYLILKIVKYCIIEIKLGVKKAYSKRIKQWRKNK